MIMSLLSALVMFYCFLLVRYAPPITIMAPVMRDKSSFSFRIRQASMTALIGTKLINTDAFDAPIFFIP